VWSKVLIRGFGIPCDNDYDFSNDDYSAWEYDEYMATKDVGSEQVPPR
jgi:hypothetical protein